MTATLKSEFKKLLTVRSTYLVTLLILFLTGLFTYLGTAPQYVGPSNQQPNQAQGSSKDSNDRPPEIDPTKNPKLSKKLPNDKLANNILDNSNGVVLWAIVVILLMAHEFRYNTITYTLTSSNSRSRVLASKIVVGASYVILTTLLAIGLTVAMTYLAVHVKGLILPHQEINWLTTCARLLAYLTGFSLIGLALVTLIRNLTASIVALFILPTLDGLLGALLSNHNIEPAKYLPFSSLQRIASYNDTVAPISHAIVVFVIYFLALWIVSWYLFVRRDAL